MRIIILLLLLLSTSSIANAQTIDSLSHPVNTQVIDTSSSDSNSPEHSDNDFAPALLIFVLFAFASMCVFVGIGILLALAFTILFTGFIGLGILSTSALVMLRKKSLEKGFKTLIVLSCSFLGLLSLAILFPLVNYITHWITFEKAVCIGAIAGAASGFTLGQIVFTIARRLFLYLQKKMNAGY